MTDRPAAEPGSDRRREASPGDPPPGMKRALAGNIALIEERRRREAREAPLGDRIAAAITRFTGSMLFVILHLLLFGGWIAANTIGLPAIGRFDPSLVMLAMVASVEAIFLSTFVLINQNRIMAASDRRADLDLHINLLAEHELTHLVALVEKIAERLEVQHDDPELDEIKEDVRPGRVLDALDRRED